MKERFETFTVLINRISRNIRKIKNQEMAEYNLRSPHISCLYYLYMAGAKRIRQLFRVLWIIWKRMDLLCVNRKVRNAIKVHFL